MPLIKTNAFVPPSHPAIKISSFICRARTWPARASHPRRARQRTDAPGSPITRRGRTHRLFARRQDLAHSAKLRFSNCTLPASASTALPSRRSPRRALEQAVPDRNARRRRFVAGASLRLESAEESPLSHHLLLSRAGRHGVEPAIRDALLPGAWRQSKKAPVTCGNREGSYHPRRPHRRRTGGFSPASLAPREDESSDF
jgi:hypothetical protein